MDREHQLARAELKDRLGIPHPPVTGPDWTWQKAAHARDQACAQRVAVGIRDMIAGTRDLPDGMLRRLRAMQAEMEAFAHGR
jgi:hypothetical protein